MPENQGFGVDNYGVNSCANRETSSPIPTGVHPMAIVAAFRRLSSACAVFFGPHGTVSHQAQRQQRSRQALYREADQALAAVDGTTTRARLVALEHALAQRDAR